jgi:hypothetical protein
MLTHWGSICGLYFVRPRISRLFGSKEIQCLSLDALALTVSLRIRSEHYAWVEEGEVYYVLRSCMLFWR